MKKLIDEKDPVDFGKINNSISLLCNYVMNTSQKVGTTDMWLAIAVLRVLTRLIRRDRTIASAIEPHWYYVRYY
jgi:hypothetical protein